MKPRHLLGPATVLAVAVLPPLLAVPAALRGFGAISAWLAWTGSGLLAASLLLMVREPAVAAAYGGLERMYRWHHALGTVAYALLLAHPLALAARHLPADAPSAWRVVSPFAQGLVGWLGWASLAGLVAGLAATFAVRLRYGLWRGLHALLGAGVLLGIAHVWAARGASLALWLVLLPAVAALAWRFLRSDRGGNARPYEVVAAEHPAERMTEVRLRPLAAPLAVAPGQFVMVAFFEGPHYHGCGEYHPFTVTRIESDGTLSVLIKALGDCTRRVQSIKPGIAARVLGPFGAFLPERGASAEVWIAGGVGIAPFLATLRAGPVERATDLVYLFRAHGEAAYLDELRRLAEAQPLLTLHATAAGDDCDVAAVLARVSDLRSRHVHLCGPPGLSAAVQAALRAAGVPARQVHSERFDFR